VLAFAREHGISWPMPNILASLGLIATDLGDFGRAIACFHEGLSLAVTKGNLGNVIDLVECVARLAAATGQPEPAMRLYGAADVLREQLGFPLSPADLAIRESIGERLREMVGMERVSAAWASGRTLSREEALAEAFALRVASVAGEAPGAARHATAHGLTRRELEVLRLLAAGHSNREIGALLFISAPTTARHLSNIYRKLGIDSRTKLAAFALRQGLA
jgi:DNA-binding CsgD family transcriptional regulator